MSAFVGIDFGTTNSAIAVAEGAGPPRLVQFPGRADTWRSVLYFERDGDPTSGASAIEHYQRTHGEGRFLQSFKSYLASRLFTHTHILGRNYALEDLIALYLRLVRASVGEELGRRAVVGRPVRYWGAESDDDDARAVSRMREALALAGFDEVEFELEPVAAASLYASRLDHDELVLIADFGGGTADFSVLTVGPDAGAEPVRATGGIGIAGDAFDARMVDAIVSPNLGRGTSYRDEFGACMPVPNWLYNHLRRWHHLSLLRSRKTQHLLERIERGAEASAQIRNLRAIVEGELGLPLHGSIERTKVELSNADRSRFRFVHDPVALVAHVARSELDAWIESDLAEIDGVLERVLADAGAAPADVDRVFTTGGSSFVPAVRERLAARFGAHKVVGGGELTSVAWGLAVRARDRFGA